MSYKVFIVVVTVLLQARSGSAVARPTKSEKEASRAAFWGLFADTYRAIGCSPDSEPQNCLATAIGQALNHSAQVDEVLGIDGEHFSENLRSVQANLSGGRSEAVRADLIRIQDRLIKDFASATLPAVVPDLELGQQKYKEHCVGCHGMPGGGPGSLAGKLRTEPKPLWSAWRSTSQMPLGVYAVLVHGVDGSEMLPMVDFMDVDDMWSIAFFVASLTSANTSNFSAEPELAAWFENNKDSFSLMTLTKSSDQDLLRIVIDLGRRCGACQVELNYLRRDWISRAPRLGESLKDERKAAEARGLTILIILIAVTSIGFGVILSRRARVK